MENAKLQQATEGKCVGGRPPLILEETGDAFGDVNTGMSRDDETRNNVFMRYCYSASRY